VKSKSEKLKVVGLVTSPYNTDASTQFYHLCSHPHLPLSATIFSSAMSKLAVVFEDLDDFSRSRTICFLRQEFILAGAFFDLVEYDKTPGMC
jgi:hypothetical protein